MTIKQQGGIFGRNPSFNTLDAKTVTASGNITSSAGNIVIGTSGKGIDFSATSGTGTSELFSDYEEGSYTVELFDAASSGNVSSSTATGYYTKIGRMVNVQFGPINNISTSGMTAGNGLRITLPFAATNTSTGVVVTDSFNFENTRTALYPIVLSSSDRMVLYEVGDGVTERQFPVSGITSGTSDLIRLSVSYIA
tara:strand:+ start:2328 stop:2912 length:585 start_codon:yes stop_codon:yes gene_type:complete